MKRQAIFLFFLAVLFACISINASSEELRLGLEDKDVHLYLVTIRKRNCRSFGGDPPIRRLEIAGGKFHGLLKKLNDLEGAVRISDKADALRFVRLRTSYVTWDCWNVPFEFEIVQQGNTNQIPTFGATPEFPHLPLYSGDRGMLSRADYRAGNFSPPRIAQTSEGYRVTRWIVVINVSKGRQSKSIQLISESVGPQGKYRRSVLSSKAVSKSTRIGWGFPQKD